MATQRVVIERIETLDLLNVIHNEIEGGRPLVAVDTALVALQSPADEKIQRRFLRLLCKAALLKNSVEVAESDNPLDVAFQSGLSAPTKRFVAVCLLRALAGNPNLFLEPTIRNRAFLVFDAGLSDIYREMKLEPRNMTHEKETGLRTYMRDADKEIREIFRPLERTREDHRWEALSHTRIDLQKLVRKLGGLILPFVDRELIGADLEDIFVAVREYLEADDSAALHCYERAKTVLQSYAKRAEQFGTSYSKQLCGRVATLLAEICDQKFERSGAGKPARLVTVRETLSASRD